MRYLHLAKLFPPTGRTRQHSFLLGISIILFIFIIWPLGSVLIKSFSVQGKFSLDLYSQFFCSPRLFRYLLNSLFTSTLTTIFCLILGLGIVFVVNRSNVPLRRILSLGTLIPLVSPPFVTSLAFLLLFGRRGLITYKLLGLNIDPYGWEGIIFVQTLSFIPIAFLVISATLAGIDSSVENAACNLGASKWRIFHQITLPLLATGLVSAALLIFISSLADFGTPMLIGGRFQTLAPAAYLQVVGLYNLPMAAVICILLITPCLLLYFLYDFLSRRISHSTITGSPTYSEILDISGFAKWFLFAVALIVVMVNLLQYSFVIIGSFTKFWGHDFSFTLKHYNFVWEHGVQPLLNSIFMAVSAAGIGAFLGIFIAYFIIRKRFWGRRLLDFATTIPLIVPGTVVGIGYILTFHRPPLLLTGTFAILIISCIFRFLPIGYRVAAANLGQIEPSIEEASLNLGADGLTTFFRITLPLMRPAFFVGFVYIFMKSMTTLSAVIFLLRPETELIAVSIFREAYSGKIGSATALSTLLIVMVTICLAIINKFGKFELYRQL